VWGTSPSSVYAVGTIETEGSEPTKFIIHFDGMAWTVMTDDSLFWWIGAGLLAGIHGRSDTAVFVVGSSFDSYTTSGFVGKWDGKRWINLSPDSSQALYSVWVRSQTDVYASGAGGTILHYDGSQWHALQTGTTLDVWQITGLPTGEIYAVASDYFNSYAGSVILRIEGNNVIQDKVIPVGQQRGIWGTINHEAYSTGEMTFHKSNGLQWEEITTPDQHVLLRSVAGTAPNDVVFAGAYGAFIHWSGKSWKFYDGLFDHSSFKSYFKAFAIGNKYFLVGNTPYHAMITVGVRNRP
jgi:hypothetical protein